MAENAEVTENIQGLSSMQKLWKEVKEWRSHWKWRKFLNALFLGLAISFFDSVTDFNFARSVPEDCRNTTNSSVKPFDKVYSPRLVDCYTTRTWKGFLWSQEYSSLLDTEQPPAFSLRSVLLLRSARCTFKRSLRDTKRNFQKPQFWERYSSLPRFFLSLFSPTSSSWARRL